MINLFKEINNKKYFEKTAFYFEKEKITYSKLINDINKIENKFEKKRIILADVSNIYRFICLFYACAKSKKVIVPINFKDNLRKKNIIYQLKNNKTILKKAFLIIFSSGTTGNYSKGILLSQKGISFVCNMMNKNQIKLKEQINEMILASFDHAFAIGRMHALLSSGNTITLFRNYNLVKALSEFNKYSCNSLSIVAGFIEKLISFNFFKKIIKNFKLLHLGSMKCPVFLRKKLIQKNKKMQLIINYGLTEAMRATFLNSKKNPNKIKTEGKTFSGVKIKIKNKNNVDCKKNEIGNIHIKGKSLALGYLNSDHWNKKFNQGWFNTGDIGYLDNDGFLIYKTREANVLNVYGNTFIAEDIEQKLKFVLKRKEIIILQADNSLKTSQGPIYVVVEGNFKLSIEKFIKILNKFNYKIIPEKIINLKKFPRTSNGKINRNKIKKLIKNV